MNYVRKLCFGLLALSLVLFVSCGDDDESCDTKCQQEKILTSPSNGWIATDVTGGKDADALIAAEFFWLNSTITFNSNNTYEIYLIAFDDTGSGTWECSNECTQIGLDEGTSDETYVVVHSASNSQLELEFTISEVTTFGVHTVVFTPR